MRTWLVHFTNVEKIFKRSFLSYIKAGRTRFGWPLGDFLMMVISLTLIASSFLPLFHNLLSHLCYYWLTSFILVIREVFVAWVPCGWWKYYSISCHLPQGARRLRNLWTAWSSRLDCPWLEGAEKNLRNETSIFCSLQDFHIKEEKTGCSVLQVLHISNESWDAFYR